MVGNNSRGNIQNKVLWNPDWKQKYESIWSIIEKFKYANSINGREALEYLGDEKIRRRYKNGFSKNHRTLLTTNYLSKEKFLNIFQFEITSIQKEFENSIMALLKDREVKYSPFNDNLQFCKKCIKTGYHSYFHQTRFFDHCAFHPNEKLVENCPKCNKIMKIYSIGNSDNPYCCFNCKESFVENISFNFLKKKWTGKRAEKEIKNPKIKKYLYNSSQIINNFNIKAINLTSNNSEYKNFVYHIFVDEVIKLNPNKLDVSLIDIHSKVKNLHFNSTSFDYNSKLKINNYYEGNITKFNKNILNISLAYDNYSNSKANFKKIDKIIQSSLNIKDLKKLKNILSRINKFYPQYLKLKDTNLVSYFVWRSLHSENIHIEYDKYKNKIKIITSNHFKMQNSSFDHKWAINREYFQIYTAAKLNNELNWLYRYLNKEGIGYILQTNISSKYLIKMLLNQHNLINKEINVIFSNFKKRKVNDLRIDCDQYDIIPIICLLFDKKTNRLIGLL